MINVNELRIGNYISIGGAPTKLDDTYFSMILRGRCEYTNEPIILTEEILLSAFDKKQGYKINKIENVINIDRFNLRYNSDNKFWYIYIKNIYLTKIEFVHELQNVYDVLNGGELCFKILE